MGAAEATGVRAGFIHLPYVTTFDAETGPRWGRRPEAIIQAVVDAD